MTALLEYIAYRIILDLCIMQYTSILAYVLFYTVTCKQHAIDFVA